MTLTSDRDILSYVEGLSLEFTSIPVQSSTPHPISFSLDESEAIDVEISRLVEIKAVNACEHVEGEFIPNIFEEKENMWKNQDHSEFETFKSKFGLGAFQDGTLRFYD